MKRVNLILSFFLLTTALLADIQSGTNDAYKKVMVKQKAKKASGKDNECYKYVEINGNSEWDEKKDELNITVDKSNDCREVLIYKSIKNVHTRSGNGDDSKYDIDIGTKIEKSDKVNVKSIIKIENSSIKAGYTGSNSNIGVNIGSGDRRVIHLNNVKIESDIKIDNSHIGSDPLGELGVSMFQRAIKE